MGESRRSARSAQQSARTCLRGLEGTAFARLLPHGDEPSAQAALGSRAAAACAGERCCRGGHQGPQEVSMWERRGLGGKGRQ